MNHPRKQGGQMSQINQHDLKNQGSDNFGITSVRTRATHYVRDASGNQMAVYEFSDNDTLMLKELDIYGSSRVGILHEYDTLAGSGSMTDTVSDSWATNLGDKEYEQTNHLGNVMSTITDKPVAIDVSAPFGIADYYDPEFVTAQDYYPFGMLQPGRHIETGDSSYRYGFNGMEKDNEVKGLGKFIDFAERIYDSRVSKFLSVDPLYYIMSFQSPYLFAGNSPLQFIDRNGEF
jgi:RHS repeat-associated protein